MSFQNARPGTSVDRLRVGIDIGGTFTDAVAMSSDGTTRIAKAPSTPGHLADGVLDAVRGLGIDLDAVDWFVHGTTAGLNALLERRGARVALVTTRGFRDVLAIGRTNRPKMYDLFFRTPEPLVATEDIFEVAERVGADGGIVTELDVDALRELAVNLRDYDAVGVVFLHSYANPAHEVAAREILQAELGEASIVCSHEVAPEWREYERTSTVATSAYVTPSVRAYLDALASALRAGGLRTELRVMQSNGGVMTVPTAVTKPIQTLFSGPVGGAMAGSALSKDLELDRLICTDMGGTSFDVSLVVDGVPEEVSQTDVDGSPLVMATVAIHTVGAGGGSIASITPAGGLRVGPQSAGSVPGPACYGRGGVQPTVTDANLFLGRFPKSTQLGGDMSLDADAAEAALVSIGEPLGLTTTQVAEGIVAVADAAMANAIREITVSRGIDPREFSLVAFGGAGALHAASIADELDIPRVIVPANPGVLSAWGMLHANTRHDFSKPMFAGLGDLTPELVQGMVDELVERGRETLLADGVDESAMVFAPSFELRYVGQEYTITVGWDLDEDLAAVLPTMPEKFGAAYLDRYGHNNPRESVECIAVRVVAIGVVPAPPRAEVSADALGRPVASEPVVFAGERIDSAIYRREDLPAGGEFKGPAVVVESSCTTLVPPGWQMTVSPTGHLILDRS